MIRLLIEKIIREIGCFFNEENTFQVLRTVQVVRYRMVDANFDIFFMNGFTFEKQSHFIFYILLCVTVTLSVWRFTIDVYSSLMMCFSLLFYISSKFFFHF
jgi:hypothetical protein